jgi:hypothetical protein
VALCAVGLALGALVAVVAHFASWTVPSTYYVGIVSPGDSGVAQAHLATPLVHPPWSPLLPTSMAIGLLVGLVVWLVTRRAGLRLVRGT